MSAQSQMFPTSVEGETLFPAVPPPGPPPPTGKPKPGDKYGEMYHDGAKTVTAKVVWATPEWARSVLARHNVRNRHVTKSNVQKVSEAVETGEWQLNGEPIIFHDNGVLANGQHRLLGIIDAGIPVPVLVVFGTKPETFGSLDQNRPRTKGDVLSIPEGGAGEKHANAVAAALGWLYRWKMGRMMDSSCVIPHTAVRSFLEDNPGIRDSLQAVRERSRGSVVATALATFLHYVFGTVDATQRDAFFVQLLDGIAVPPDSHMAILMRWIRNKSESPRTRMFSCEVAAVVIKTWNRIRTGVAIKQGPMVWRSDEGFPTIDGIAVVGDDEGEVAEAA